MKKQVIAEAELAEIRAHFDWQHNIDDAKATAIAETIDAGNKMQPILVIEDEGNGYAILDGHHRAWAASRICGQRTMTAWVISVADYTRILAAHFGGESPTRMSDLDDYITCDGRIYATMGIRE